MSVEQELLEYVGSFTVKGFRIDERTTESHIKLTFKYSYSNLYDVPLAESVWTQCLENSYCTIGIFVCHAHVKNDGWDSWSKPTVERDVAVCVIGVDTESLMNTALAWVKKQADEGELIPVMRGKVKPIVWPFL